MIIPEIKLKNHLGPTDQVSLLLFRKSDAWKTHNDFTHLCSYPSDS
jgi:hypothetical protein